MVRSKSLLLLSIFVSTQMLSSDQNIARSWLSYSRPVSNELVSSGAIVTGSIGAAVLYGVTQDMFTVRNCFEYFSHGFHKDMMDTWNQWPMKSIRSKLRSSLSPNAWACAWGIAASWWVGALAGIPIALASRIRTPFVQLPQLSVSDLVLPTTIALGVTGFCSWRAAKNSYKKPTPPFMRKYCQQIGVPKDKVADYYADVCAHRTAYRVGKCAALGIVAWVPLHRYLKHRLGSDVSVLLMNNGPRISLSWLI